MSDTRAMPSLPAVNRFVHYVAFGSADGTHPQACRSALITAVGAWVDEEIRDLTDASHHVRRVVVQHWDPTAVAARVFTPTGEFIHQALRWDSGEPLGACYGEHYEPGRSLLCTGMAHAPGTWHWPVLL